MPITPKKASLVDQFIAAKVKDRYTMAKEADVNDYSSSLRLLKAADAEIASLLTLTHKYESAAKKAFDDFEEAATETLPRELEKIGVPSKNLQRYFTQIANLLQTVKKGHPLRAFSFKSESPVAKVQKVLATIGKAILKESGAGAAIVKPALATHIFQKSISSPLGRLKDICADWYAAVLEASSIIEKSVTKGSISEEPHRIGFGDDAEFDRYAKAQREFAAEAKDLSDLLRHCAIGLPLASSGFEDCEDVGLCLKTMAKTSSDLIQTHLDFGKRWGDYRAKLQDRQEGQSSLF